MIELGDDDVALDVEAAQGGAAAGTVTATGARAGALVGRRVLVGAVDPCGDCEVCRRGGGPVCPLARHRDLPVVGQRLIAAARWVVALGDGLELPLPAAAAVAGDVTLAYTLYARTGIAAREPAVVAGTSPIARFLVEILRAKGITPTVVVDPSDAAWGAWLLGKGAALARVAPDASDAEARAAVTAAVAAQGIGARPWRVIAAGSDAAPRAVALAGPRATVTLLAPVPPLAPDALAGLVAREVTLVGVFGAHPDLVVEAAAMCVKGDIELAAGTTSDAADRTRSHVVGPAPR